MFLGPFWKGFYDLEKYSPLSKAKKRGRPRVPYDEKRSRSGKFYDLRRLSEQTDSHTEAIKLAKKLVSDHGGLPNTKVCERMSCEQSKIIVYIC